MIKLNKKKILNIKTMREEGLTNKAIATVLGITPRTVNYWIDRMRKEGIDIPKRKSGSTKINLI